MTEKAVCDGACAGKTLSLYIHVPFCVKRCDYCEFYSTTDLAAVEDYFVALETHIRASAQREQYRGRRLVSVYFGGGTPSVVHGMLAQALEVIRASFTLSDDCEITVEANPESFWQVPARELAAAGFNRVSLGVQSLHGEALALLGRAHNAQGALLSLRAARDAGFRVSADIMLGLPQECMPADELLMPAQMWEELLNIVDHIAVYPLTVEEGTVLEDRVERGVVNMPGEDEVAAEIARVEELLSEQGFARYEISSYARPGEESRQNLRYWQGGVEGDYLGLGPSAASMSNCLEGSEPGSRVRFVQHETLEEFLADSAAEGQLPEEVDILTPAEARREDIMLALRTSKGASVAEVEAAGLRALADELVGKDLLELTDDHYRCTKQGWLLGNIVFSTIWLSGSEGT